MKLGANSVLFGGHDMEVAFKYIAMAGYDGIELSAIDGMSEHLVLNRWRELAHEIKRLSKDYSLELLAMEQPSQDHATMEKAFQATVEIGADGGAVRRDTVCESARRREHLQHADHSAGDGGDFLPCFRY